MIRPHAVRMLATVLGVVCLLTGCDGSSPTAPTDGGPPGGAVTPAGPVSSLGGACPLVTFRVDGVVVQTTTATVFEERGCGTLANGDEVSVEGVRQPDGSVVASVVTVAMPATDPPDDPSPGPEPDDEAEVHPQGIVTGLGGACPNVTFRVGGVLIRTTVSTVFDEGGCPALSNGLRVRVDGLRQPDGSVLATEVEVGQDVPSPPDPPDPDDDGQVRVEGLVSGLGGACPNVTFRVDGTQVRTSAGTVFEDAGCADLSNGDDVRVDGLRQPDGSVLATEVEAEDDGPDPPGGPSSLELFLEIDPDEWRLEWATGSQSGGGGSTVRVRIDGDDAEQIIPSSIELSGPGGTIRPVDVEIGSEEVEADFAKIDAIGVTGGATEGARVTITVTGRTAGGAEFSLAATVDIRS